MFFSYLKSEFQPIHGAATKGHINILQLLVDVYGVDPTAKVNVHILLLILGIYVIYYRMECKQFTWQHKVDTLI